MRTTISEKPYSEHIGDKHLTIVLCEIDWGMHQFVTWLRNSTGGDCHGHYFSTLDEAISDYDKRGVVGA